MERRGKRERGSVRFHLKDVLKAFAVDCVLSLSMYMSLCCNHDDCFALCDCWASMRGQRLMGTRGRERERKQRNIVMELAANPDHDLLSSRRERERERVRVE